MVQHQLVHFFFYLGAPECNYVITLDVYKSGDYLQNMSSVYIAISNMKLIYLQNMSSVYGDIKHEVDYLQNMSSVYSDIKHEVATEMVLAYCRSFPVYRTCSMSLPQRRRKQGSIFPPFQK